MRHCRNERCQSDWIFWEICHATQLCAQCLFDRRVEEALARTWVDESTPEFEAASREYDRIKAAGVEAVDDEISNARIGQCRRVVNHEA